MVVNTVVWKSVYPVAVVVRTMVMERAGVVVMDRLPVERLDPVVRFSVSDRFHSVRSWLHPRILCPVSAFHPLACNTASA